MTGGREQGFALILVLWSLVLFTLITTQLVTAGRTEAKLARNLRAAAAAEMVADSAVYEAMFHMLDRSPDGWGPMVGHPTAVRRRLVLPGGVATVLIEDEAGRVNPNQASEALLQALLRGVGADAGSARGIAAAIADWRSIGANARPFGAKAPEYAAAGRDYSPPEAPFRTVEEVGLVLGMTPTLLARLTPYLTIAYDGDPDPTVAQPIVVQALRDATGQQDLSGGGQGDRTVAITAEAETPDGGRYIRHAVVRLGKGPTGRPYWVFDWRRASD